MATLARRQPPLPPQPSDPIDPAKAALQRIANAIARGFDADRVQGEAAEVISTWATTLEADDLREQLDVVHEQLTDGIEAAQDMGSEIEPGDAASARLHQRSIGALMAARDAFGLAVQRL